MNINDYIRAYALDEKAQKLTDEEIEQHIKANPDLSEEVKDYLIVQLKRGDHRRASSGFKKMFIVVLAIGSLIVIWGLWLLAQWLF